MVEPIAHNRPLITAEDRAAVEAVLGSGWIAEGVQVRGLEEDFSAMLGGGEACAVSSGTAALFLALRGLGIGKGDGVAVPSYSCSAVLNAVYMAGAEPLVVDVRAADFTIDPKAVRRQAPEARAAIAVHCFGATAGIAALKAQGLLVVEDCCQSLGGPQGREGDAAVYSFYATKIITGGQGGLVWDAAGEVAVCARDYREFDGRKDYVPRFNLQMTDIQAALVRSQFRRLDAIKARRRAIYDAYRPALPAGWGVQAGLEDGAIMPYRFVLRGPDADGRNALRGYLERRNVSTIVPVARFELLHRYLKLDPADYPAAEALVDRTLSLPLYSALSDDQVETVRKALDAFP